MVFFARLAPFCITGVAHFVLEPPRSSLSLMTMTKESILRRRINHKQVSWCCYWNANFCLLTCVLTIQTSHLLAFLALCVVFMFCVLLQPVRPAFFLLPNSLEPLSYLTLNVTVNASAAKFPKVSADPRFIAINSANRFCIAIYLYARSEVSGNFVGSGYSVSLFDNRCLLHLTIGKQMYVWYWVSANPSKCNV